MSLLINKQNVKNFTKYLLARRYEALPSYKPTQIAASFFQECDDVIRAHIAHKISTRPSIGKTVR